MRTVPNDSVMIAGTAVIVYETLVHNHTHVHRHYVTHTHDGTTHTHVIDEKRHGHTHPLAELEGCLDHRTVSV